MSRDSPTLQCLDFLAYVGTDDLARMIVRRERPWAIVRIATFVLVASVSASGPAEFSKLSTTIKLSPHLTRPVMTQPKDRLLDDELAPHSAFPDRVGDRSASLIFRNNFVPSRSYFTGPKNYERFAPRNSPGPRAIRYKRYLSTYVAFSGTRLPNASDSATIDRSANASENKNDTLIRIPLYRLRRHIETGIPQAMEVSQDKNPISSFRSDDQARENRSPRRRAHSAPYVFPSSRTRRSLTAGDNYPSRKNVSDYYAERRAVMARFYARQREIKARYGNSTNFNSSSDNAAPRNDPVTSNATLFRLYSSKNSSFTDNRATFRHPSMTIDPVYSNVEVKLDGQPVVQEANRRLESRTWNSSNVESQVIRYTTPVPCANASLSGTFAPKKRSKIADVYFSGERDFTSRERTSPTEIVPTSSESNGTDHEIWGKCKGKVMYQHNLNIGLKGPSTLDTVFEVIIQGPVCITCVEVLRYNETRAEVKFESGGRGHDYVKLKLQGYENEGFSYIIKIWGIRKIRSDCSNV